MTPERITRVAVILGILVAAAGVVIMLGWVLDVVLIPSGVEAQPHVKANTGLAFLLGGLALALHETGRAGRASRLLSAGVLAIGGLSLSQYVFGVDLGIDELLFTDTSKDLPTPGRMSSNTATGFTLAGGALLAATTGRLPALRDWLALGTALIGWLGVLGHIAGLPDLLTVGGLTRIALPTAICFVALGAGALLVDPSRGIASLIATRGPAGPLVRRLLLAALMVPPAVAGLLRVAQELEWIDAGAEVLLIVAATTLVMLAISLSFARSLDAAERRRLLAERDRSRLAEVVETSRDAIVISNLEGEITAWNRGAELLFGWSEDEIVGRRTTILVPMPRRAEFEDMLESIRAGGAVAALDTERRHRDGSLVAVNVSDSPLLDEEGRVAGYSAIYRDIRERRAAQAAVARSERRFRGLVEAAPDATVIVGEGGRIELANAQAERMFGYAREELVGRNVEMLVPERFRAQHPGHRAGYVVDPRPRPMGAGLELHAVRADGSEFPVEISLSPLETGGDRLITAAVRDVTERRRAEEELERSNVELQQFAYVASHDLQEPLRVIAGFSELLANRYQGKLDEEADSFIEAITSGTRRMQTLIEDLLGYSRVGTAQIERAPVDANRVVSEVVKRLRPAIEESGAQVEVARLPDVRADERMLEQLFQNLISNAVKFTGDEEPRVEVLGAPHDGGWEFVVSDNGPGVEPRYRERIFEMFQRLHGRAVPGTGIGLPICKRIVERHGGRIWVETGEGGGARFVFTLPTG